MRPADGLDGFVQFGGDGSLEETLQWIDNQLVNKSNSNNGSGRNLI
jgi:hypothetical protein